MSPGTMAAAVPERVRFLARRFLILTIVVIGALCGVAAVLFHRYVEFASSLLFERALKQPEPWRSAEVILIPAAVFAAIALLIRRFAPRAVGANLARVRMAYTRNPALLGRRSVAATFLVTPLSLGAGAPLGPEGPIVVVTSGISAGIARMLKLPKALVRGMIPVGVAAGIAAVFNTPITGVVFALEEVFGSAERGLLGGVIVGAVAAAVVERALLGGRAMLEAPLSTWTSAKELIGFALLGILSGLFSGYAIAATHRLKPVWARLAPSPVTRSAIAGAMIGTLGLGSPAILGVGYGSVSSWLQGGGSAEQSALAFGIKTLAFVVAISAGVVGGTFAPSLFMGAALGATVGHSAHLLLPRFPIDPRVYSVLGMGAFFAGLLRSPIAAVLIVVELTRDYDLMVPLMLAVSLSVAVSRRISRFSMVEQQMADEGYVEQDESTDPLSGLVVGDVMAASPVTVRSGMSLLEAARSLAGTYHRMYIVTDDEGRLAGIIQRETIDGAARNAALEQRVEEVMESPTLVADAGEPVLEVVQRMQMSGVDRCPVVDGMHSLKVVGFLTPSDLFKVRFRRIAERQKEGPFDILPGS